MELHLLGPVEASVGGQPVPLGPAKQRAVLAMLALHPNTTVSSDDLVEGLWGEHPPSTGPKMVQQYVSQLRRVLDGDGDGAEIVTHGRGYELHIAPDCVDAGRFRRFVAAGASRDVKGWRSIAVSPAREARISSGSRCRKTRRASG